MNTAKTYIDKLKKHLHSKACKSIGDPFVPNSVIISPYQLDALLGDSVALTSHIKTLKQYGKLLTYACHFPESPISHFISGHPNSCVDGLEWFKPMCEVYTLSSKDQGRITKMLQLWKASPENTDHLDDQRSAFALLKELPNFDPDLMHFFLNSQKLRGYEVHVAGVLLRLFPTMDTFLDQFHNWRSHGLTLPLLLACDRMPHILDWVPEELSNEASAKSFSTLILSMNHAHSPDDVKSILMDLSDQDINEASGQRIAQLLDRVAILMRVKSNGWETYDLNTSLQSFPDLQTADLPDIWSNIKNAIECSFPPSLLATLVTRPLRDTWGYPSLTYQVTGDGMTLRFSENKLQWVSCKKHPCNCTVVESHLHRGSISVTPYRLQSILQKTGEIILGDEITHVMMFPMQASRYISKLPVDFQSDYSGMCANKKFMLSLMDNEEKFTLNKEGVLEFIQKFSDNQRCIPTDHTTFRHPHHVLAWKLETPTRVVAYSDEISEVNMDNLIPHMIRKVVIDEKSPIKGCCHIHTTEDVEIRNIRDSLLFFYNHNLISSNPTPQKKTSGVALSAHVVEEAITCFIKEPPAAHTTILQLNQSTPWEKDQIDSRSLFDNVLFPPCRFLLFYISK